MASESGRNTSDRGGPEARLGRLRFGLSELQADALLVTQNPNIRYLCNFSGSSGLLLVEPLKATLFTDSRYTFQAEEEVSGADIRIVKKGLLHTVSRALKARHRRYRVAYSPAHMTVAEKLYLERHAGARITWVDDRRVVDRMRAVKDNTELSRMREAAILVSRVFHDVLLRVKPGMKELAIAAEIEHGIKGGGASGPSFETIVASGPRSAWAHARPSSKPLKKGELVVLDLGAIIRGYCSDMTRTVHVGRAPASVKRMYQAVRDAQQAAKRAIQPGVKASEVDRAARSTLRSSKLDRFFTHSTGHGLGLEVHEMPRLGRGDHTVLREGMVLTVEPGVYLEGLGGIRIEDDVVVTRTGCSELTTAPREFLEL